MGLSNEKRIFGPPGTGKTYILANKAVPDAVNLYGAENVLITSFTRTAAKEVASRVSDLPDSNIGTLHSFCFHGLGQPKLVHTILSEWNDQHPNLQIQTVSDGKAAELSNFTNTAMNNFGEELYNKAQIYRAKMIPEEKWEKDVLNFHHKWTRFKEETFTLDYTDLIEKAIKDMPYPPLHVSIIFVDEAQDFTKLELSLLRRWALNLKELVLVGDDDQCQPAGTKVLTIDGYKNIEDLDPEKHRLVCYDKASSYLTNDKGFGFNFKKEVRDFSGDLYRFSTENNSTPCTANHKWAVKFNNEKRKTCWKAVYLMQKGDRFRVGMCQLFRDESSVNKYASLHLPIRMNLEGADAMWLLDLFRDSSDASIYESYINSKYGIPTIMFKSKTGYDSGHYSQKNIDWLFNELNSYKQFSRAFQCLLDHDLDINYPFYTKGIARDRSRGSAVFELETINIFKLQKYSDFLMIPEHNGNSLKDVKWTSFTVSKEKVPDQKVYSLDVEKHKTYVADGLITHNSIFGFSGATPESFLNPPVAEENIVILDTSYRVPKKVHSYAVKFLKHISFRQKKEYYPKDDEVQGEVIHLKDNILSPEKIIDRMWNYAQKGETSILIASCGYMLNTAKKLLRENSIPFHNPYRPQRKDWNPIALKQSHDEISSADILFDFISSGDDENYWTVKQFITFAQFLKVSKTGLIRSQGKKGIEKLKEALDQGVEGLETTRYVLHQILGEDAIEPALNRDLDWLYDNLQKKRKDSIWYLIDIYKKRGIEALTTEPKIIIGTIHSLKGGEADNVFLAPDISKEAYVNKNVSKESNDALLRLFYVGATRSKNRLFLLSPSSSKRNFINL
ncbi:MAG: UvrD-helicase domain-containing protein [Nanobdellota archaeon]